MLLGINSNNFFEILHNDRASHKGGNSEYFGETIFALQMGHFYFKLGEIFGLEMRNFYPFTCLLRSKA